MISMGVLKMDEGDSRVIMVASILSHGLMTWMVWGTPMT